MNYFQTVGKAVGDYLAALQLFFNNLRDSVTAGVNASTVLKEGGVLKTGSMFLRAKSHFDDLDPVVIVWDQRGYGSFKFLCSGNAANTYQVEGSNDLVTWTPIYLSCLGGGDTSFPLCPLTFKPPLVFAAGTNSASYGANTLFPFVRINRKSLVADNTTTVLFVIELSGEVLDINVKPFNFYSDSVLTYSPVTGLTSAADAEVFPTTNANTTAATSNRWSAFKISLYNAGTVASEVQLLSNSNVVLWRKLVPASSVVVDDFPSLLLFPSAGNNRIQIKVVTASAIIYPIIQGIKLQA